MMNGYRLGLLAASLVGQTACGDEVVDGGASSAEVPGTGGVVAGSGGAPAGGAPGGGGTQPGAGGAQPGAGGAQPGAGGSNAGGAQPGTGGSNAGGSNAGGAQPGAGGSNAGGSNAGGALPLPPFEGEGTPWTATAPRATCRAGDTGESGLQGLGTNVRCNIEIRGQVPAEHFLSLAWHEDCAYVNGATGTSVIDVSDSSHPTVVTRLVTPGMQSNWESMKVHEGRGLLVGYQSNAPILDVYDVSADCKTPVLRRTYNVGGSGHSGNFSTDGTIYYASSLFSAQVFAVDLTDPANPTTITSAFDRNTHDLSVGKDGNRGYFVYTNVLAGLGKGSLGIMDLTQIQARTANARGTLIKEVIWEDGNASQYPIPVTYRGRDYIVMTDELGSGSCVNPEKPQFGYARIFDIQNETAPTLVSKIKTEAQDPAHCQAATAQAGTFFGVGTHYCNVDRREDPRVLSCGLWSGGVRLYDIRNPWRPKELAYFNVPNTQVPGLTRIRPEEREVWVSMSGTFYVLRLPEDVFGPIFAQ